MLDLSKSAKQRLLRMMYLLNEIDYLKEEHITLPRPDNIQNTIDVLEERAGKIRETFVEEKPNDG